MRTNVVACFHFDWFSRSIYSLKHQVSMSGVAPGSNPLKTLKTLQPDTSPYKNKNNTSECPSVAILPCFHLPVISLSCKIVRSVSSDSGPMPSSGDVTFKVRTWVCSSHDMTLPTGRTETTRKIL